MWLPVKYIFIAMRVSRELYYELACSLAYHVENVCRNKMSPRFWIAKLSLLIVEVEIIEL